MKKLIIAAIALVCSSSVMALDYEPEAGLTHRAYVGMSISNIRNSGMDAKVGHSVGYIGEYVLPGCAGTFVNFGFDYSMLGAKLPSNDVPAIDESGNPQIVTKPSDKLRTHYFSIPLHVGYRYNCTDEIGIYADFGPYFGLGVAGKWAKDGDKFFKKSGDNANRLDCGLGFRLGAEYNNHLSLTFGFNWGLTKLYDDENGSDPKNFNSTITLGYRF